MESERVVRGWIRVTNPSLLLSPSLSPFLPHLSRSLPSSLSFSLTFAVALTYEALLPTTLGHFDRSTVLKGCVCVCVERG